MIKEAKIYIFKSREDYVKGITDDNVINVIGTKGSGKTTSTLKYFNTKDYVVVNCDRLFELPENSKFEDECLVEIREMLKIKYGKILEGEDFYKCYKDIINYVNLKNKKVIIEGNVICDIKPIASLKGTVIVKRIGILKCFIRTIKRDYPNKYFLNLEIKKRGKLIGRIYRFKNIVERRVNIFYKYHDIEKIIDELDKC